MNVYEWLRYGLDRGWAGPPLCETHDGTPTTPAEDDEFEEGMDPCIHIIRLYPDKQTRDEVEANHSPSQWRKQ
jgi:hypothetical protein